MQIQRAVSLATYTTFHLDELADELIDVNSMEELMAYREDALAKNKACLFLGGGSNVLVHAPVAARVIVNRMKGIRILEETEDYVDVWFAGGEVWHDCVLWCVERGYGGIENLALIPGTIGAAPIQNIGAYGVELSHVLLWVETVAWDSGVARRFSAAQCALGYRDSIFKQEEKNKQFITAVVLRLQKKPVFKLDYGDVKQVLQERFRNEITLNNIAQSIIHIRQSKLPDPATLGNAGSFFKNPVVEKDLAETLHATFPDMPQFTSGSGIKIPAAWLIERCGPEEGISWKGYRRGACGVHQRQALVLVNYGGAQGADILRLSEDIIERVHAVYGILLEREVNVWPALAV